MQDTPLRRIVIVGLPGAGKSTLAVALGSRLGLPVCHKDRLEWRPGWARRPAEERRSMALNVIDGEAWVFDGWLLDVRTELLERADLVIWADPPQAVRTRRILWRMLRYYGRDRLGGAPGCPEGVGPKKFASLRFSWRQGAPFRERIAAALADLPDQRRVVHLRTAREVRAFLASVQG